MSRGDRRVATPSFAQRYAIEGTHNSRRLRADPSSKVRQSQNCMLKHTQAAGPDRNGRRQAKSNRNLMFVAAPIRPNLPIRLSAKKIAIAATCLGNIMMRKSLVVCPLLLALAAPVLANNGNGNGHASGNGNNGQANSTANGSNGNGSNASAIGALNGFMHASFTALSHASVKSEIGKVITYGSLLQGLFPSASGTTTLTTAQLQQLSAAIAAAANKPLTPDIISAIDARLGDYYANSSGTLNIATYTNATCAGTGTCGATALAGDIAANLPAVY